MTYSNIADMAEAGSLIRRLYAGAASEGHNPPQQWVDEHRWALAAQPGWDSAWASAEAANNPNPGADETVITDAMILSAIQALSHSPDNAQGRA